jgi:hypothetical protein
MTWNEIRKLYLSTTGNSPGAVEEAWVHLTNAYRKVACEHALQALEVANDTIPTVSGVDTIALPANMFHILHVENQTDGFAMWPEESGMRGRARFLAAGTGMPPLASPTHYTISDGLMYLRGTPDDVYTIARSYKIMPAALTEADGALNPLTQEQFDYPIAIHAAVLYFGIHPEANRMGGDGAPLMSDALSQTAAMYGSGIPLPKDRERFDQRGRMWLAGYNFRGIK